MVKTDLRLLFFRKSRLMSEPFNIGKSFTTEKAKIIRSWLHICYTVFSDTYVSMTHWHYRLIDQSTIPISLGQQSIMTTEYYTLACLNDTEEVLKCQMFRAQKHFSIRYTSI